MFIERYGELKCHFCDLSPILCRCVTFKKMHIATYFKIRRCDMQGTVANIACRGASCKEQNYSVFTSICTSANTVRHHMSPRTRWIMFLSASPKQKILQDDVDGVCALCNWQHGRNLRSTTTTLCQPSTTTTLRRALTDALLRLFGTHCRKRSLIVTPLLCWSLG